MTTLVQHLDAERLSLAIRQDPLPAHAAAAAAESVDRALGAYQAPGLESRRLAEEAAGAVKDALSALAGCTLPAAVPVRRPPPPRPSAPPIAPPAPQIDYVTLAPLACALAALPLQGGPISSLLVLAAAGGAGFVAWRASRPRAGVAPQPAFVFPAAARPLDPPPPAPALQPEVVVGAVRRALASIDDLVATSERRRAASHEPTTLNDATLEFLQDLAEAALRGRAEFALAKIEFRLPIVLEACDLQSVEYRLDTAMHFDIDGNPTHAVTRRPALLSGTRCVKRGLAATVAGRTP